MNKIYKFQKGRNGQRFQLAGRSTMGFPVWVDTQTGHLYTSDIAGRRNPNRDWGTNDWSQWEDEGTTLGYFNASSAGQINGNDWIKKPAIPTKKNPNEIIVDGKKYASVSDWRKERTTKQQKVTSDVTTRTGTGRGRRTTIRRKITPKGQEYWNSQYQTFLDNMSEEQKAWLKQQGIDYSTAQRMQGYLSGMGENIGNTGMDNKWGSASQKAWEHFVDTTMKNNPLQTPTEEQPVVDAPDPFGYKTVNTYEGADFVSKLNKMGIRSNADLMHFMYESQKPNWKGDEWSTQFRNDVDKLLGGDYSDDNIRKVFNTQGKWGIGFTGRGDFGDFQNALQTNAGLWNGMYDAKEQASRTGASGIVYSSPEMMRKFESIKLQPNQNNQGLTSGTKFDFSNMKFNNIFTGNTGATTLGNIPSTKPINLSQEFTKDLTPNIPSEVYKPNTSLVYKPGTSDWLDWAQ